MKKVLIMDTSVLCVRLQVAGMLTCGPDVDRWDHTRVMEKLDKEEHAGVTLVMPLAAIIETGNHIAQIKGGDNLPTARSFIDLVRKAAQEESPWAAFAHQHDSWSPEGLEKLLQRWEGTVASKQSLGDASIVDVAEFYAKAGYQVEIFTGDQGLKAYQPVQPLQMVPRRKR